MSALGLIYLKWLEPMLTFGAGVYAMLQPRYVLVQLLPPAAQHEVPTGGVGLYALEYSVRLYALVLILLAVVEHLTFRVRAETQSKRALLMGMVIGDILHFAVVGWTWFCGPYAVPFADLPTLDAMQWSSLATNYHSWIATTLRIQYLSKVKLA